jgi:flagellar biosynthesis protein FliR
VNEALAIAGRFGLEIDATLFALVFARMAAVVMLLPGVGEDNVPVRVRLGFAIVVTLAVLPGVAATLATRAAGPLVPGIIVETAIGLGLGLLIRLVFFAIGMAGSIAATQIGLSGALFFDPSMGAQSTAVTRLVSLAAIVVLFALDIHHMPLRAAIASYHLHAGTPVMLRDTMMAAIHSIGMAFLLAIQLSVPFLAYGVLFNIVLGLVNRLAPQIQLFFIAQPLNLLMGLALLGLATGPMLLVFANRLPVLLAAVIG